LYIKNAATPPTPVTYRLQNELNDYPDVSHNRAMTRSCQNRDGEIYLSLTMQKDTLVKLSRTLK